MAVLVDTSILLRLAQPHHPNAPIAARALRALRAGGETLYIAQQNVIELVFLCCLPYPMSRRGAMAVELTSDQKAFARRAVETGRLVSEDDAVREALALWEERERRRLEFCSTIDEARASLARGEGRPITQESMRELSEEVRERGRVRLIAELARAS